MHLRSLFIVLPLALTALSASAADAPGDATPDDKGRTRFDYSVRAVGGYFDGMGVRTDSGGIGILELDLTPKFKSGKWSVEIPLQLDHQQTFGADLNETVFGAGLDLSQNTAAGIRHGFLLDASYTLRPNWPDLYQPDPAGGLASTNRYSNFRGVVGWHYWNRLGAGRNLRAKLRYVHTVYPRDPNYNEADSVVHLAPRDNGTVKLDTSYRAVKKHFAYAVKLDGFFRQDFVLLSKNADTGGTSRSNPRQRLAGIEPQAEIELRTGPVDVTLGYGFLAQKDLFEGYYSYTGHNPFAEVQVALNHSLTALVRAESRFITFGKNSKADTEDGKTLFDTRYKVKGGLRYRLAGPLALVADAEWLQRDTNFRDYVPGVYPVAATRPYDIKWDYTNVMVTGGVEWRPGRSDG